jgi:hypothetical protein
VALVDSTSMMNARSCLPSGEAGRMLRL